MTPKEIKAAARSSVTLMVYPALLVPEEYGVNWAVDALTAVLYLTKPGCARKRFVGKFEMAGDGYCGPEGEDVVLKAVFKAPDELGLYTSQFVVSFDDDPERQLEIPGPGLYVTRSSERPTRGSRRTATPLQPLPEPTPGPGILLLDEGLTLGRVSSIDIVGPGATATLTGPDSAMIEFTGGDALLTEDITVKGVTVGNLTPETVLELGMDMTAILKEMLTKRIAPTYVLPTSSLALVPPTRYYEVGTQLAYITLHLNFQRNDAGPATQFNILRNGISAALADQFQLADYLVTNKTETFVGRVSYAAGAPKPNNMGEVATNDPRRVLAGVAISPPVEFSGVYPWFSGSVPVRADLSVDDLYAGEKTVAPVGASLQITTFGSGPRILWFAVPAGTKLFTHWYRTPLDQGDIGGPTNLFADPVKMLVTSTGLHQNWTREYDVYVTNYATEADVATALT